MNGETLIGQEIAAGSKTHGGRREEIEELLSSGSPEAAPRLATYWREHRTPAGAHFVVNGFQSLLSQLALKECRISILRSFTLEPVLPLLKAAGFSAGLHLQIHLAEFNAYVQEILDAGSRLYSSQPDVVILAVQTSDVAPELWHGFGALTSERQTVLVSDVVSRFRSWIGAFRAHCQADLIVHNLQLPAVPCRGVLDSQSQDGQQDAIVAINRELRHLAAEHRGVHILDYDGLVARYGRSRWSDERKRLSMSLPIAPSHLIHICEEWMRFLQPLTGRIAKAVVVDLDNTLWHGVLGEDGIDGIRMGPEYPGAMFREVQRALLDLHDRGILLAIASKNEEEEALEVLARHRDMLLRPEHFAAWRINWKTKSDNLREIADELNIGVDMLAFVDDNPVERERVSVDLPEVTIVDLPDDPVAYAQMLRECPAFERLRVSEEDLLRGQYYTDQRKREAMQRSSKSPEDFFRSLQQVVEITPVAASTLGRVAQLTQKTNQFNLTTRRYTEQEITTLAGSEHVDILAMRVKDVYNDNGIVGVALLRYNDRVCDIDTFLLSCRVIGRTVETAFLSFLCQRARTGGAVTLSGSFRPTRKNGPAADFYLRHGFQLTAETPSECTYQLDLSAASVTCPTWIQIL